MTGEVNSLVVSTGDWMGDGMLSAALGILGLAILKGDDGAGGPRAGDWWRLEAERLGSTRLLRFLSRDRVLTIRLRLSSALGESDRLWLLEAIDECMLVSLSAPVSLSKASEPRLWKWYGSVIDCVPYDFGVTAPPRGLLALDDPAEDVRLDSPRSEELRIAIPMADAVGGRGYELARDDVSDCSSCKGSSGMELSCCSTGSSCGAEFSLLSLSSPAAMRAALSRAASMHSCTRTSYSWRIRSEYSKI